MKKVTLPFQRQLPLHTYLETLTSFQYLEYHKRIMIILTPTHTLPYPKRNLNNAFTLFIFELVSLTYTNFFLHSTYKVFLTRSLFVKCVIYQTCQHKRYW